MKPQGLDTLAQLREAMRLQQAQAQAQAAAEAQARALAELAAAAAREAAEREKRYFADQVGPVHVLPARDHATLPRTQAQPEPRQRWADERQALAETLSGGVDAISLLLTDDGLSFRRPEVHPDVVSRLRRGHWAIQGEIDLHGLRREQAREALRAFLRQCARSGQRCVRVVHGKGNGSPGRQPVLKAKVQRWLAQSSEVVAFTQASGPQGGAGALIVLLAG